MISLFEKIKALANGSDTVAAGAQILNEGRKLVGTSTTTDAAIDKLVDAIPDTVKQRAGQSKLFRIAYHAFELVRLLFSLRQGTAVAVAGDGGDVVA